MPAVLAHDASSSARASPPCSTAWPSATWSTPASGPGIRGRSSRPSAPARQADLLRADHYLHMRCEVSTELVVQDFAPFADDPLVRLVSLMDHTPGQRQFVSVEKYREYNQGRFGLERRPARRPDRAPAGGAGPLRGRPPGRHHRALPQARPPAGEPRRRHRRARGRGAAGRRGHRGVPDHAGGGRGRARLRARGPGGRARTWCAAIRTRATSRRPSWPRAACSTCSPRTTCRRACSTGRSCSISSTA